MEWKTSSIFSMTRGLRWSNLWMASRTNSSTSAAAASLVSLRNSISCKQRSGSVKLVSLCILVLSVNAADGSPREWRWLPCQGSARCTSGECAPAAACTCPCLRVLWRCLSWSPPFSKRSPTERQGKGKKKRFSIAPFLFLFFNTAPGIGPNWPPRHSEMKLGPAPAAKSSFWPQGQVCWEHAGCPSQGPKEKEKNQSSG